MAMANNNPEYRSLSSQAENAEPAGGVANVSMSTQRRSPGSQRPQQASASSTQIPQLRKTPSGSLIPQTASPAGTSPRTSRNTSPIRRDSRPGPLTTPISTQPSAAAIQRALSAAAVPQLQQGSISEAVSKLPRQQRSAAGSGDTTPQWPLSPRLKSPPPSAASSRRNSAVAQKKAEATAAPSISVTGATPETSTPPQRVASKDASKTEQQLQPNTPKMSSRGPSGKSTLETVQENSSDVTEPSPAAKQASKDLKPLTKLLEDDKPTVSRKAEEGEKHTQVGESGSESTGNRSDGNKSDGKRGRRPSQSQPPPATHVQRPKAGPQKSSYAPLTSVKSRQPEGTRNMTVETETVQSIPQSALSAGDRSRGDNSGSVRLKPSNETIRPKKERKKPSHKARSINQGTGMSDSYRSFFLLSSRNSYESITGTTAVSSTASQSDADETGARYQPQRSFSQQCQRAFTTFRQASGFGRVRSDRHLRQASSKADIFEARVASQVDDVNSSDSDETFVYESNPPEQRRPVRHHSRTPSVTSAHSTADQRAGIRNFGDMMDDRKVAGKRSMKFSNNPYNDLDSPTGDHNGTVRSHQPRHYGRWGRGGSHASMFDQDSPFTQASKLRNNVISNRHSRPNSPRSPQSVQHNKGSGLLFGRKKDSSYDFDGEIGDDERTPLIGSVRTPRSARYPRRMGSSNANSIDEYYGVRRHSRFGKCGGFFIGVLVIGATFLTAIAFLVMSNRAMYDVRIRKIQNVLASEQEIMLDLLVGAVNPNPLGIAITDMDINVFAKSNYVGTEKFWSEHGHASLTTSVSEQSRKRRSRVLQRSHNPATAGNPNPWQDLPGHWHSPSSSSGVDKGTDPQEDLGADPQTMLLGRIFHFDQGLAFEGSPIKRHLHYSVGELRLMKPGNKTEIGGSARWENVLQHPFELIIRGVLKYSLPISGRPQSAAVGGSVLVHPEDGVDDEGAMRSHAVNHDHHWQWVDHEDAETEPKGPDDEPKAVEVKDVA